MNKQEIGKVFIYTPVCTSTNTMAQHWASNHITSIEKYQTHGWVFATRHQIEGRGQAGNTWLNQAGKDAAFSVLLKPADFIATDQFYLNMAACLSIYDALKKYVPFALRIKWPNDILIEDKKMGGILIENSLSGNSITTSIVGIGLNINSIIDARSLPKAISLSMFTNKTFTVIEIIHQILFHLNKWYTYFSNKNYALIKETYLNTLYKKDEIHGFTQNNHSFIAKVIGVTYPGKLLLELQDGTTMAFGFKEITWL